MSGATKLTYWSAHYVKDVTILMIFGVMFLTIMEIFAQPPDGFVFLYIQFALAEPLFVYTICYFFCAVCNKKGLIAQIILVSLILVGQTVANNLAVMRISSTPSM